MPEFNVHTYAVVRIAVKVEAPTPVDAAKAVTDRTDLYTAVHSGQAEYAEQIDSYLVDVLDDQGERSSEVLLDADFNMIGGNPRQESDAPDHYASLSWSPEDVQTLRPDWTLERCRDWLTRNEKYVRDRLCELGWDVIGVLLPAEGKEPHED